VAIIGGLEKGMELWNPQTGIVELLWDEIPPEVGGSDGLRFAEILLINDGSELIVYGGDTGSTTDEIWKYNVESNIWTKYFKLFYLNLNKSFLKYFFSSGLEIFYPKEKLM